MSRIETKPEEPCYICNSIARSEIQSPELRALFNDLVSDMPANRIEWLECWNCFGRGFTGGQALTFRDVHQKWKAFQDGKQ